MAVRFVPNWKAPCPDKIQGLWIKSLDVKKNITRIIKRWMREGVEEKMKEGRTQLLFKGGDPNDAKNWRPITCINIILKVFTSIMRRKVERSLMRRGWMERNQLGWMKESLASKEGLVMTSMISNISKKKRLTELDCDVAKADDSINHEWMLVVMQQAGIEMRIIKAVADMGEKWKIHMVCGRKKSG